MRWLIEDLEQKVAKLEKENAVLTQQVSELTSRFSYCDLILNCKDAVPISVIAKDYGLSAKRLNKLLNKFGVQYKIDGTWLLYQKYAQLGWTHTKTYNYNENCSKVLTCWTQKGRFGIYEILKQNGYLPLVEQ